MELSLWTRLLLAVVVAFIISFAMTPIVKSFAVKIGAMDVPTEKRRVHDHPIPRMGGLAIFIGFLLSVVLFADITQQVQGILLGAIIIVMVGAIDDIISLPALVKLAGQIVAAGIAIWHGVIIEFFMNPNVFSTTTVIGVELLSLPITLLWIVGVTNAVNLIDGLDGLACGVSSIASLTMFVVALIVSEGNVAIILGALLGACIGFLPYNFNPAKIFMGDTGSQLLGYVLATASVIGLFKFYAVVTFLVPLLALALPLTDTTCAIIRRLLRGQSPFHPDRGHLHHRLIDMGLSQKQAVAILYSITALLGLCAVVIVSTGKLRVCLLILAIIMACVVGRFIRKTLKGHEYHPKEDSEE